MPQKNKKYNHSALVARFFGFEVNETFSVSNDSIRIGKNVKKGARNIDNYLPPAEEVVELINQYREFEKNNGSVPRLLYFDNPATGSHAKHRKRPGERQVSLHIIGVDHSIADALMMKAISIILGEDGSKKHTLQLNNIGDKESIQQFNKEATAFFRKHINMLSADCRQFLKENVHTLITEGGEECKILKEHSPEPMDFLDEITRKEFGNLIEKIETFNSPYEINQGLLGDSNYSDHTIFHFIDKKTKKVLASGTRYNHLSRKMGMRRDIPAIGANIWIKKDKKITQSSIDKINKSPNFLLQLGDHAKTFALEVLTELWNARIYTKHDLTKDKLAPQIQLSQKEKAKNIIIIGHKEAMDMNVMLRDAEGKSQKILKTDSLIRNLKKLL